MGLPLIAASCAAVGPPQPTTGLGAQGKCTETSTSFPNPTDTAQTVSIYEPGGSAAASGTGGTCDDTSRPVAVVVHGLDAASPTLYQGIIDHLVTTGNVVIFATYNTDATNFIASYNDEDSGLVAAAPHLVRADLSRLGMVGHSMGAGALPYLTQKAVARNWGAKNLWFLALAPWYVAGVGTGPVNFPPQTHAVVENYDNDGFVDNRIGIELFKALTLPASQKIHVTVNSDTQGSDTLNAYHTSPNSVITPDDAIKFYGIYRTADVLENCSLLGTNCNASLTFMGNWGNGQAVKPAIATETPVDTGPTGTAADCNAAANPRAANCGPSSS